MRKVIERVRYADELDKYRNQDIIKVLTGIRRCGKSPLFAIYQDRLRSEGIAEVAIQSYNFESPLVMRELGKDWESIFFAIHDRLVPNQQNYVFLDEIQQLAGFEKLIDGLYVEENVDLYLTGSNAFLLSGELATLLTGRQVEIHVLPYSFSEFKKARNLDNLSNQELFALHYLLETTLPEGVSLASQGRDAINHYTQSVYQSILENDIYPRIKDVNRRTFENIFKYVLATLGSEVSPNSIMKGLKRDGIAVDRKTVNDYLEKLCDSYLLYKANRFEIRGKQQLATMEKYYVPDLAIRNLLVGRRDLEDRGHFLENIVYFELLRRGGQIWVGKIDNVEVDFVVKKNDGSLEYYQVSYSLADEATLQRELGSLKKIKDAYPKYLITADLVAANQEGIIVKNVVDWLLEKD